MTVDTLLATAWDDHGDRPHDVAARLAGSLWMVDSPEQIPPFAHLLTHVLGEHLGQWQRGIGLLEALRACRPSMAAPTMASLHGPWPLCAMPVAMPQR